MTKFYETSSFAYHLDSNYIPSTKQFGLKVSSTYTECRFPDEKRKLLQLNLSKDELDCFIAELVKIRNSN